jgi:hypothetical protein
MMIASSRGSKLSASSPKIDCKTSSVIRLISQTLIADGKTFFCLVLFSVFSQTEKSLCSRRRSDAMGAKAILCFPIVFPSRAQLVWASEDEKSSILRLYDTFSDRLVGHFTSSCRK